MTTLFLETIDANYVSIADWKVIIARKTFEKMPSRPIDEHMKFLSWIVDLVLKKLVLARAYVTRQLQHERDINLFRKLITLLRTAGEFILWRRDMWNVKRSRIIGFYNFAYSNCKHPTSFTTEVCALKFSHATLFVPETDVSSEQTALLDATIRMSSKKLSQSIDSVDHDHVVSYRYSDLYKVQTPLSASSSTHSQDLESASSSAVDDIALPASSNDNASPVLESSSSMGIPTSSMESVGAHTICSSSSKRDSFATDLKQIRAIPGRTKRERMPTRSSICESPACEDIPEFIKFNPDALPKRSCLPKRQRSK